MRIEQAGRYNPRGLMESLMTAFPEWRGPQRADGVYDAPQVSLMSWPDRIVLEVPDDADQATIDAIVRAHDPDVETAGDRRKRERRGRKAAALARLKANPALADLIEVLGL